METKAIQPALTSEEFRPIGAGPEMGRAPDTMPLRSLADFLVSFTREDVAAARLAARTLEAKSVSDQSNRLWSLADRIEALLPPR